MQMAQHLLADAQPVPEQHLPDSFLPNLHTEHDTPWYGLSFWPAGVCCPACVTAQLLVLPMPSASSQAGQYEKLKPLT